MSTKMLQTFVQLLVKISIRQACIMMFNKDKLGNILAINGYKQLGFNTFCKIICCHYNVAKSPMNRQYRIQYVHFKFWQTTKILEWTLLCTCSYLLENPSSLDMLGKPLHL